MRFVTSKEEYYRDAMYLKGASEALQAISPQFSETLRICCDKLNQAGNHMCGQGYFGCHGGEQCSSDHK